MHFFIFCSHPDPGGRPLLRHRLAPLPQAKEAGEAVEGTSELISRTKINSSFKLFEIVPIRRGRARTTFDTATTRPGPPCSWVPATASETGGGAGAGVGTGAGGDRARARPPARPRPTRSTCTPSSRGSREKKESFRDREWMKNETEEL